MAGITQESCVALFPLWSLKIILYIYIYIYVYIYLFIFSFTRQFSFLIVDFFEKAM